jgi:hypothetical protein
MDVISNQTESPVKACPVSPKPRAKPRGKPKGTCYSIVIVAFDLGFDCVERAPPPAALDLDADLGFVRVGGRVAHSKFRVLCEI